MTLDVADLLLDLDLEVRPGTSAGNLLLLAPDGKDYIVEIDTPVDRITAHSLRNAGGGNRRTLHVGRTATPGVLARAVAGEIDVLIEEPTQAFISGHVYRSIPNEPPHMNQRRTLKRAWFRLAVMRVLILADRPLRQTTIADQLGTSQQTVSNAAKKLGPLVGDRGSGLEAVNKRKLLDHFLAEYPGAEGQLFGWYSLKTPLEQATSSAAVATFLGVKSLISADAAADQIAPWKLPSKTRLYISDFVDLADDGFVQSPLEEATLVTCIPKDPTLWRTAQAWDERTGLADPVIVCWDLLQSTDVDSAEAIDHLKSQILEGTK